MGFPHLQASIKWRGGQWENSVDFKLDFVWRCSSGETPKGCGDGGAFLMKRSWTSGKGSYLIGFYPDLSLFYKKIKLALQNFLLKRTHTHKLKVRSEQNPPTTFT